MSYVVTAIIVSLVLFLRFRSMKRTRRLRLETLWIVPALYTLVTAAVLYQSMPEGTQWLYVSVALAAGGLVGWWRGAMMRINVDPQTHALYTLVTAAVLYQSMPEGTQWLYVGVALAAGGLVGWWRGAMMRINVDPETHALNQQASPTAMLFILVIIIIRQGLRTEATGLGLNAAFLADLAVVFALGMFSTTRLEMFIRARRMLRDHLGTATS